MTFGIFLDICIFLLLKRMLPFRKRVSFLLQLIKHLNRKWRKLFCIKMSPYIFTGLPVNDNYILSCFFISLNLATLFPPSHWATKTSLKMDDADFTSPSFAQSLQNPPPSWFPGEKVREKRGRRKYISFHIVASKVLH